MRTRRAPKSPGILMCVSLRKYASGSTQGCQSMGPRFNLCHGPEIRWALFWTDVPSCVKSTLHLSTAGVEILNEQRERPVANTNTAPETRHVKPFIKWTYLKWYSGMNLVRIWIWLNPHKMMVEVILNQVSILVFPKCPLNLSYCHLEYHSWISVYFFNCKLTGWWRHNMTILKNESVHWNSKVIF